MLLLDCKVLVNGEVLWFPQPAGFHRPGVLFRCSLTVFHIERLDDFAKDAKVQDPMTGASYVYPGLREEWSSPHFRLYI